MNSSTSNLWCLLRSGKGGHAFNMACDEALLQSATERGRPVLRFYEWTEAAVSFGYFQKYAEVEQMTHLRPLVRRPTGGGVVPHDADWTYSVAFPPSDAWYALKAVDSYRRVHEWVRDSFVKLGVAVELASCCRKALPGQCFVGHEKYDVMWHDRKIAGAAQRRTKNGLLIQGSVQPPPIKLQRGDWESAMCETGRANYEIFWNDFRPDSGLIARIDELAAKVYSRAEYNRRR